MLACTLCSYQGPLVTPASVAPTLFCECPSSGPSHLNSYCVFLCDSTSPPCVYLHPELGLFIRKHLSALTLGLSDQLDLYSYFGQRTLENPGICFTPTRPSPSRNYAHQFPAPTNHILFPQFLSGDLISACLWSVLFPELFLQPCYIGFNSTSLF